MEYSLLDKKVQYNGNRNFIAPSAAVIGEVILASGASVWFNATLRADCEPIYLGENTNVQDGAVLHVDPGFPVYCARDVTIGHKAMLHGCTIGEGSLVGINAVVLNGAIIGRHCLIAAGALVTEGAIIPDGSLVMGAPAKVKKALNQEQIDLLAASALQYAEKAQFYIENLKAEFDE